MKKSGLIILLLFAIVDAVAQFQSMPFSKVELRADTLKFTSNQNLVTVNKESRLYFKYNTEEQVCEVRLFDNDLPGIKNLKLLPSADFELLDSLINFNNEFIKFRVRFANLSATDFLGFTLSYVPKGKDTPVIFTIPLLPYTDTNVELFNDDNQLFIGEEKTFELSSNHLMNIQINNPWTNDEPINYRLSFENGHLYLHLISPTLGKKDAQIKFRTHKPFIDSLGRLQYDLPVITRTFTVKESRLRFLNMDTEEIILDNSHKDGYLIQLDNQPYFTLQKTYRVEDQENPGGPLIAEIFTENYLNNGKLLSRVRPYSLHRKSEGYLYIKDNDIARFILNVNIIPKTLINKVSILPEGGDWTTDLNVKPGENIDLKIEGESLHLGQFTFEGLSVKSADTLVSNDNVAIYHLRVPFKIALKQINIYHDQQLTGYALTVKEFQKPRQFDYIYIDTNGLKRNLNDVNGVIMASNVIQDVVLSFDRDKIDSEGQLYGKQFLQITITIRGKNNELIEIQNLDNIQICPGSFSPRAVFYDSKNCLTGTIELNRYLNKKTYDLEEWSRISIEIKNKKDSFNGDGYTKNLDIILKRSWRFDIDVSFPAGLLTFGGENSGSLTGISMAMIAQFSFYENNRINRFKPYKIGFGFIALDAFNLSNNTDTRDIAMVILGSLYPTRKESKLTFPLYFGGGYKLKNQEFFFVVGPGIRISL